MTIIWALVAYIIHFVISNKVVRQIISHSRVIWFIFTPKIVTIIIKLIYYSTYAYRKCDSAEIKIIRCRIHSLYQHHCVKCLVTYAWTKSAKKINMQNQIFIFRTSIKNKQDIKRIKTLFTQYPTIHKWNVDLEDWEKILRIECLEITPIDVLNALQTINIYAEELE